MTMQEQYDLFGELVSKITDPIVGLQVKLQSPCCCHCDIARGVKGEWLNVPFCCEGSGIERDVDELMAGWVRWWDGKPTDHVMVRVADHIPPKKWIELGDSDEQQWETDLNGKRRDPWQFTNYLPMMNEKRELFTFTTGSRGGIGAIAGLARRYTNHRRRHPDVFPLIALSVDSYQHPNREFGRIKFPVFAPAGYAPKKDFLAALAAAGIATAEPAEPAPAETEKDALDDIIDDTIPY
jgi:hypothetical protein